MKRILIILLFIVTSSNVFAFITQGHFRWRNNNGNEQTATWKAGQDSAIKISDYKAIRLRVEIYNAQSSDKTTDRNLQYATSVNGPWFRISNNSAINAFNFAGDNGYIKDGDSTTQQITDPTYAFQPGNIVTGENLSTDTIHVNKRREYEWCIKPTSKIQPATTYYFKSSAGSDQSVLPSLTTTGTAFVTGPQPLLSNGGFENNLTGWTTATANTSAATFNITTTNNQFHTGAKALKVNVTNVGSPTSAVTLSSGSLALSDTGTYMLRFWAISSKRNALLDINLKGATTSNTCHYQIYNRFDTTKNGWQMYQYAFKVSQGPVTLQLNFNSNATYYLDDVEIINDTTNPEIDVKNQFAWQNNFAESYGWVSGDNNNPVLLPDNRVAWVYNDSFMGNNNPHSNVLNTSRIINNLVVLQNGDQLSSKYNGTAPNSQALFSPGNGNLFWQSGGVVENGLLKVVLIEINNGNYANRTWIGSLTLPNLGFSSLTRLPATITSPPNCIIQDGDYDYIYFGVSSAQLEVHTVVGRVPVGQLESQTAWQFYAGNNVWTTDFTKAANLLEGSSAGNVVKLGPNNYAMSAVPNLSSEIDVWFAQSPIGPWVNKTTVYNIPQEEGILAYQGHLDPLGNNGVYTFTYSVYPFVNEPDGSNGSVAMQIAVKTTYVPCYAKANLLQLSPFSSKPVTNYVTGLSNLTSQGRQTLFNFTTSLSQENHIEIEQSSDNINWNNIATIQGSDTTTKGNTFRAIFTNPKNGQNYFRIKLFDADNVMTISPSKGYLIKENAVLSSFSGTATGSNSVNLSFSTSSELLNEGFLVQSSTDATTWKTIIPVQGAGTNFQTSNYNVTDNAAIIGLNYYRVGYYSNGVPAASAIVMVDTRLPQTNAVVLNVNPNPANSAVRFDLKGYSGKTFTATLTSLYGKELGKQTFIINGAGRYTLNSVAQSGTYILNIKGDNLARSSRVLVK